MGFPNQDEKNVDGKEEIVNWKKNTALYLAGQGISIFGSMLVNYAIIWHVTLKTQSGSVMTVFTIAAVLPMFFISPFAGVWADRYNRKHLINIADACVATVTLIMAAAFFLGFEYIGLLFFCSLIRGVGQGVQHPAESALIPMIAPEAQLTRINGINSSIMSVSMLAAPMLSGAILSFAPIQYIFLIDVVTAAIGISILYFLVKTPLKPKYVNTGGGFSAYVEEMKEGFGYIRGHSFILQFIFIASIYHIMACPAELLTPLQVARNFGADVWRLTAIEVAFSAGLLTGGLIIGIWGGFKNRTYSLALSTLLFGIETILLGIITNFWAYLACMAAIGLVSPLFMSPMAAIFQSRVDQDYMGRVFSVLTMIASVMMPFGMVIFGPLSDVVSIDYLLIGTGVVIALLACPMTFSRAIREAGKQAEEIV